MAPAAAENAGAVGPMYAQGTQSIARFASKLPRLQEKLGTNAFPAETAAVPPTYHPDDVVPDVPNTAAFAVTETETSDLEVRLSQVHIGAAADSSQVLQGIVADPAGISAQIRDALDDASEVVEERRCSPLLDGSAVSDLFLGDTIGHNNSIEAQVQIGPQG